MMSTRIRDGYCVVCHYQPVITGYLPVIAVGKFQPQPFRASDTHQYAQHRRLLAAILERARIPASRVTVIFATCPARHSASPPPPLFFAEKDLYLRAFSGI
jgi:hypothetical protein